MGLSAGTRLGPYEILSAAGAGGMGEVYRARDTRLERTVAVKVLPAHLSSNPDLRQRFEREAKVISSLQHPHICTLFDVGHQDETDFLVMEYLEGETLAQRLQKGAVPPDQALKIGREIANAMDKAHRQGIVHRDLKPGNIMLTKAGAKLMDFGLAKLRPGSGPAFSPADEVTAKEPPTAAGTVLGTLQYISPEQLEALDTDARTDIFALGVVIYEMITGKKAFSGKTSASLIAKILETDPPPISSLQPLAPTALDHVVRRCLAKDPDARWQSARDLEGELKWIAESESQSGTKPARKAGWGRRQTLLWTLGCLVAITLAAAAIWELKPAAPRPVTRFSITLPKGRRLGELDRTVLAFSPGGKYLVYAAIQNGTQQLYLQPMDGFEAKAIPGTEAGGAPFFSPDGQWIGFVSEGKIKKVSLQGDVEMVVAGTPGNLAATFGGAWGPDGTILFQTNAAFGRLWRVAAAGGNPERIHDFSQEQNGGGRWPAFLPGSNAVMFNLLQGVQTPVGLLDLKSGKQKILIQAGASPRYAPTGHLLYGQGGALMAAPFDLRRMELAGPGVPVIEGVMQATAGLVHYSFSETGSLAYLAGVSPETQAVLVWVDRKGTEQPLPGPPLSYTGYMRISPDARRVALSSQGQIWIDDLVRETRTRMTSEIGGVNPMWTVDGKRIVFQSGQPTNLFWQPADGSGKVERLTTGRNRQAAASFSPDGQVLAYIETTATTGQDIWTLRLKDRKAEPFLQTPANEGAPRFSPDGHYLAYVSDESGQSEVYVQPYPGPGAKTQISNDGGTEPLWNPKGKELFYREGDKMMEVNVSTGAEFTAGKPRMLFERAYRRTNASLPAYDISQDGQRFLLVKTNEQEQPAQINVVLNWFEELKRLAPVRK